MKRERITIVGGATEGQTMEIVGTLTIGRSIENALQLNDLQISRKHAVIQQTNKGTLIRDLNSGNGTFIGDRRIIEHRLADGDVISLGQVQIKFESVATADEPAEATIALREGGVKIEAVEDNTIRGTSAGDVYQTFVSRVQDSRADADQLRRAQQRLAAVYEANQTISSERDLQKLFARVIEQIFQLVPAHNGVILLKDQHTGELRTQYRRSDQSEVKISSTIVKRASENGEAVITYNAADDARFGAGMSIIAQNITSAMCTPLAHQSETLGVIYVDTRGTTNAFTQGDLELLVALSGPAAIAIKNAQYVAKIERAYQDTLIALSNAIELRDHYTVGHTWRVTNVALEIGKELGWTIEKLRECEMGGLLHDVGKIAIDDAILRKAGGLTDDEYAKMKVHPERGARMLQDIEFLIPLIPYALYHHERFDGKGYPFGLAGEDIPIEGRVLAVADTFDAMTSNRPYRKGLDIDFALSEIAKGKGTQFDPVVADALIRCHQQGRISRILQDFYKSDEKSIACPFCSTYIRVPEQADIGAVVQCNVCHRHIQLNHQNNAWYGNLLAATDAKSQPTQRDTVEKDETFHLDKRQEPAGTS